MTGLPVPWLVPQGVASGPLGPAGTTCEGVDGLGSATSTAPLVERAAVVGVAALRLSLVVQMVPALVSGTHLSPRPTWYVVLWSVAVCAAVLGATAALVRHRPVDAPLVYLDVALAVGLLVLSTGAIPVEHRIGSWVGWTPGYALTVACTSGTLRSTRAWLLCLGGVVAGYFVYVGPLTAGPELPTIVADALGYVVLAGTVRLIVWYLRRISRIADAAQSEVGRLARLEEEHRAQLAMHDATAVMQLLADPTLPSTLRAQLQSQAVAEVQRMRSYLRREPRTVEHRSSGLRTLVGQVCEGFPDLGIQLSTDLLDEVVVDPAPAAALVAAVRTVLHNVRRHAGATGVVVHGDVSSTSTDVGDGGAQRWTISVSDDGCGFDVDHTPLGLGLGSQVVDQLAQHAITTSIRSAPGQGTRVELSGVVGR